jgi:vitamin B12 transporter
MKKIISLFFSFFIVVGSSAQDSLLKIREVIIKEKKVSVSQTGLQKIDSITLQFYKTSSLQTMLQMHSNVFVKNYGVGALSTISIRGSSAAQTATTWFGLNINQAATGLSDFSSIPSGLFDQINIHYGQEQDEHSMGGSIQLKNDQPNFKPNKVLKINLGLESLLNMACLIDYKKMNTRYANQSKLFFHTGLNRYHYFNPEIETTTELKHATSSQVGLTNDFYWNRNNQHQFQIHTWIQSTQRNIPPASFETESLKTEKNTSFRNLILSDRKLRNSFFFKTSFAQIIDAYQYRNDAFNIAYLAQSMQIPLNIHLKYAPNRYHEFALTAETKHSLLLNEKNTNLSQASVAFQYQLRYLFNMFNVHAFAQKGFSNRFQIPFITALNIYFVKIKQLQLYASHSQQVRIPTLNELYFKPGGNLNLKPEQSKSMEAGIRFNKIMKRFTFDANLNVFARKVNDWIAWFGNAILTPRNIQTVKSKGCDAILHANYELPHEKNIYLSMMYAYTISTTFVSNIPNDFSIGKQIPYVPRYQLKGSLGFRLKKFNVEAWQTYTGYRFITTDESKYLKPYFNTNLFISSDFCKKKVICHVKFNNIFNQFYESVVGRIMPGRNIAFGLQYHLN